MHLKNKTTNPRGGQVVSVMMARIVALDFIVNGGGPVKLDSLRFDPRLKCL